MNEGMFRQMMMMFMGQSLAGSASGPEKISKTLINSGLDMTIGNPMVKQFMAPMLQKHFGRAIDRMVEGDDPIFGALGGLNTRSSGAQLLTQHIASRNTRQVKLATNNARERWIKQQSSPTAARVASAMIGSQYVGQGFQADNFGVHFSLGDTQNKLNKQGNAKSVRNSLAQNAGRITEMNLNDRGSFANMNGADIRDLISTQSKRGFISQTDLKMDTGGEGGASSSVAIRKIKEAAKKVKSIGDIIKGPLKEVEKQLTDSFGGAAMNTLGMGGLSTKVNQFREVARIGGFSVERAMGLMNPTKALISQLGGYSTDAISTAQATAADIAATRGDKQEFVDSGRYTSVMARKNAQAKTSPAAKRIAATIAAYEQRKGKGSASVGGANSLRNRIIESAANGGDLGYDALNKLSGMSVDRIQDYEGSFAARRESMDNNTGMQAAKRIQAAKIESSIMTIVNKSKASPAQKKKIARLKKKLEKEGKVLTAQALEDAGFKDYTKAINNVARNNGFENVSQMDLWRSNLKESENIDNVKSEYADFIESTSGGSDVADKIFKAVTEKEGLKGVFQGEGWERTSKLYQDTLGLKNNEEAKSYQIKKAKLKKRLMDSGMSSKAADAKLKSAQVGLLVEKKNGGFAKAKNKAKAMEKFLDKTISETIKDRETDYKSIMEKEDYTKELDEIDKGDLTGSKKRAAEKKIAIKAVVESRRNKAQAESKTIKEDMSVLDEEAKTIQAKKKITKKDQLRLKAIKEEKDSLIGKKNKLDEQAEGLSKSLEDGKITDDELEADTKKYGELAADVKDVSKDYAPDIISHIQDVLAELGKLSGIGEKIEDAIDTLSKPGSWIKALIN